MTRVSLIENGGRTKNKTSRFGIKIYEAKGF